MSITKHQLFKIKIFQHKNLEIDNITSEKINEFLSAPNNVYVNHSVCILTESIENYGSIEQVNRFVLISLIYEDLDGTAMDLSNASSTVKQVVKREMKASNITSKPIIETEFDKVISKFAQDNKDSEQLEISKNKSSLSSIMKRE